MEKIIKKSAPGLWFAAIIFSLFSIIGCNNATDETKVVTTDSLVAPAVMEPAVVMPKDSVLPLDSTTKQRPGGVKAKPVASETEH
ncbi:MAG: hypothetical protein ABI266_00100 [Ginsengibacter sp.]